MIEGMLYLFKTSEGVPWERVEPVVGGTFKTRWEHVTQEEIIMRVDYHLILVLREVLDGINRTRVALDARHYELFGKTIRGYFLQEW